MVRLGAGFVCSNDDTSSKLLRYGTQIKNSPSASKSFFVFDFSMSNLLSFIGQL